MSSFLHPALYLIFTTFENTTDDNMINIRDFMAPLEATVVVHTYINIITSACTWTKQEKQTAAEQQQQQKG
jgi:hypothetical protein